MPQLFSPSADRKLRRGALGLVVIAVVLALFGYFRVRSSSYWNVGVAEAQPIPFNHALHVKGLGMECGYCHTGAQTKAGAGMPAAETCLTCHSQIWRGVPALEPLHTSEALGTPIVWNSVIYFPDFARFHHGSHMAAGLKCSVCHGKIEEMEQTVAAKPLSMGFCVDCHEEVQAGNVPAASRTEWMPPAIAADAAPPASHADGRDLTDCSVCHY